MSAQGQTADTLARTEGPPPSSRLDPRPPNTPHKAVSSSTEQAPKSPVYRPQSPLLPVGSSSLRNPSFSEQKPKPGSHTTGGTPTSDGAASPRTQVRSNSHAQPPRTKSPATKPPISPNPASNTQTPPLPNVAPANPVLTATQSQWYFTDEELQRTPSALDGMSLESEFTNRRKGVNFIMQVGIMLKLPQFTIFTASVYMQRFFMRNSMENTPTKPGMHPYTIGATALYLATKVDENCRRMKEYIIACCRIALKNPDVRIDEQSKEFWKWRDAILHHELTLLEVLCFDLQLELPHRFLYEFMRYFQIKEDKTLRNASWAFLNDSMYTVLCVQLPSRVLAAGALYAGARHCNISFSDDQYGRPWWEQLGVDIQDLRRVCDRMADIYEMMHFSMTKDLSYRHVSAHGEKGGDKTRKVSEDGEIPLLSQEEESEGLPKKRKRPSEDEDEKDERGQHRPPYPNHSSHPPLATRLSSDKFHNA